MPSSFVKDREFGKRVEVAWLRFMQGITGRDYEQSEGLVAGWDIHDLTQDHYYEVKWDTKSCAVWSSYGSERKPTGNLFIEYVNPSNEKETGICVSTSKYWVYVVKYSPDVLVEESRFGEYKAIAHLFNREKLLEFCQSQNLNTRDTKRDVEKGKSANARGWILPWSTINNAKKQSGWLSDYDISDYLSVPILTK